MKKHSRKKSMTILFALVIVLGALLFAGCGLGHGYHGHGYSRHNNYCGSNYDSHMNPAGGHQVYPYTDGRSMP